MSTDLREALQTAKGFLEDVYQSITDSDLADSEKAEQTSYLDSALVEVDWAITALPTE